MIASFSLHRPNSVREASRLLNDLGPASTVYCGGTELLQVMKMGLAAFDHLIDLKAIDALQHIEMQAGSLRIGAAVTHRQVEQSLVVRSHLPSLAELEKQVANVRVRNSGSIGGNLCFAEPHSDPATLLIAAGAYVRLERANATRDVPLSDFILGPFSTARKSDEILVSITVPPIGSSTFVAYRKIAFRERPVATVAARFTITDGLIEEPIIVVGAVGDRPVALAAAGVPLAGVPLGESDIAITAAAAAAAVECDAASDLGASEDYQRHLVRVLTRRALRDAVAQATAWITS
jgi:carbon-monoxide dehydrogenase medium subunit